MRIEHENYFYSLHPVKIRKSSFFGSFLDKQERKWEIQAENASRKRGRKRKSRKSAAQAVGMKPPGKAQSTPEGRTPFLIR